jgi:hypothetical protein
MLWQMLSAPGRDVSPLPRAALISWRAISGQAHPRASRCRRSDEQSSWQLTATFSTFSQVRMLILIRI